MKPTKFQQEQKMFGETVDRKDLSASTSTVEEDSQERMIRKTTGTVRQDVEEVSTFQFQAIW